MEKTSKRIAAIIIVAMALGTVVFTSCSKEDGKYSGETNNPANPLVGYKWTNVIEREIDEVFHRTTEGLIFRADSTVRHNIIQYESYMGEYRESEYVEDGTYTFEDREGEMSYPRSDGAAGFYTISKIELVGVDTLLWYGKLKSYDGKRDSFYVMLRQPLN